MTATRTDVLIVGGGPVGLLLACRLAQNRIPFLLVEKRDCIAEHSRAIGIHPPALDCLAKVGVANELCARGVRIRRGIASDERRVLGALDFTRLPGLFAFVLTVPQFMTECILEKRLRLLAPDALRRGICAVGFAELAEKAVGGVRVALSDGQTIWARIVVGCDGKNSGLRGAAKIGWHGGCYPDTYVMGDFRDDTDLGDQAALFLARNGIIESFPLPENRRRWVVKTGKFIAQPTAREIAMLVEQRTKTILDSHSCTMRSGFGVEHWLADEFVRGPYVLAGDAAHVCSPIGGQGMNLGWLDADALSDALSKANRQAALADWAKTRRRAARRAIRRAAFNTIAGRATRLSWLRARGARYFLRLPGAADYLVHLFTLQGLDDKNGEKSR